MVSHATANDNSTRKLKGCCYMLFICSAVILIIWTISVIWTHDQIHVHVTSVAKGVQTIEVPLYKEMNKKLEYHF